jgi:hypothetical protein
MWRCTVLLPERHAEGYLNLLAKHGLTEDALELDGFKAGNRPTRVGSGLYNAVQYMVRLMEDPYDVLNGWVLIRQ